ncbi:hypothetical protein H7I57_16800 [Mycobacterium pyrenivorans]|nr:hypothetical protein [Mycolicibacterium pyrenivorans]
MVVERGLARCPRCVSVADYVFIETRSGAGGSNGMRYEVRCRKCGECYGEDSRPLPTRLVAVPEPPIEWPRDREPVEPRDWRTELRERLAVAAQRLGTEIDATVQRTRTLAQRTRTLAPERWFARGSEKGDQTGG